MQMTWRWYSEGNDQIKLSYIVAPGFLVSNQNRKLLFNDDGTPTARSASWGAVGALIKTVPTGTNVNDIAVGLLG